MDPTQFDAISRSMANRVSRRQALARLGTGGLVAGLVAAVGRGRAGAVLPVAQAETCRLEIVANVRLGPGAGALLQGNVPGELRGDLSFALGPDGAIDGGRLRLEDDEELPVVGQATGRAINLRVRFGDGQTLVLVGTAEEGLERCTGAVDGLLTGPQAGDLGDWHATATALGGGNAGGGGGAEPTALARRRRTAATETAESDATETAEPEATETATAEPTEPAETAIPAPTETPEPAPTEPPATCAEPLVDCGGACIDPQSDVNNCGACSNVCASDQSCRRGICAVVRDHRCDPGLTSCNGICVDTATDPNNCGGCGVVCGSDQTCFGGQCAIVRDNRCAPLTNCNDACVDLAADPANCGACGNACADGEICFGGQCARDQRDG